MDNKNNCGFKDGALPSCAPLAMAYVPMQAWEKMYDQKTALVQGTAFPSLNLIFCGVRGKM